MTHGHCKQMKARCSLCPKTARHTHGPAYLCCSCMNDWNFRTKEAARLKKLRSNLGYVAMRIEAEGFDYCFREYSNFEEVKDAQFHKLRLAYKKAADALEQYVEEHAPSDPMPEDV